MRTTTASEMMAGVTTTTRSICPRPRLCMSDEISPRPQTTFGSNLHYGGGSRAGIIISNKS